MEVASVAMAIYKYVTEGAGLAYLRSWHLRLSSAASLNDPFELSPTLSKAAEEADRARSERLLAQFRASSTGIDLAASSRSERDAKLPPRKGITKTEALREAYGLTQGLVSLTRTARHLLMWSHYAESHRGMLLEFDERHPCFSRSLRDSTFQGRLIPVTYSDARPVIEDETAIAYQEVLSTKALEWAYEQEVRLFWPISRADGVAGNDRDGHPVHRYSVPTDALRSVTFGCRVRSATLAEGVSICAAQPGAAHVLLRRALVDAAEFRLHYEPVAA